MRFIIIGNGTSGIHALLSIVKHNPKADLTLISDDEPIFYSRPQITSLIEDPGALNNIEMTFPGKVMKAVRFIHRVVDGIDLRQGRLYLNDHTTLAYDCLILATGAYPKPIKIIGAPKERIFTLRTAKDARKIASLLPECAHPVVLGGGLIGLKIAHTLTTIGIPPRVVVSSNQILSRTLDSETASRIQKIFESQGVTFHLGTTPKSADWDERGKRGTLLTKEGTKIPFDILLVAKGVAPRVGLAQKAGLLIENGGIAVSESMETSFPHHYAAGDCASIFNHEKGQYENRPIWPVASESGRVAGEAATGKLISSGSFSSPVSRNAISFFSVPVVSIGTVRGSSLKVSIFENPDGSIIRKFFLKEGKIVGAVLIGDITHAGMLFEAIRKETRVREIPGWLFQGTPYLTRHIPTMEVLFS